MEAKMKRVFEKFEQNSRLRGNKKVMEIIEELCGNLPKILESWIMLQVSAKSICDTRNAFLQSYLGEGWMDKVLYEMRGEDVKAYSIYLQEELMKIWTWQAGTEAAEGVSELILLEVLGLNQENLVKVLSKEDMTILDLLLSQPTVILKIE